MKNKILVVALIILSLLACRPTATPALTAPVAVTASPAFDASPTAIAPRATPTPAASPTPAYDPFVVELPPAKISFAISPAIQHVTETTAMIYFAFADLASGSVFYRSATTPIESISFGEDTTAHLVTLPDLQPGTTYDVIVAVGKDADYRLPLFLDDAWGRQTVTTPPFASPLRFAAIGDSGFGDDATVALVDQMLAQNPAFVLHVGDVVYNADDEDDPADAFRIKYFQPFAPLLHRIPVYPSIGNHDVEEATLVDDIPYYFTAFPPFGEPTFPAWNDTPLRKWYAFSFAGIQFLSLDSQALFGDPGNAEQQAWLEERLADPKYTYTIPFFHVSPYSSSRHRFDGRAVRRWADLFEATGVPLVVSGHEHAYERLAHGPTTYIISGGGSSTLYELVERREESQFFASESQFTLFDVYPDRIEARAIREDGSVIDSATIATPR